MTCALGIWMIGLTNIPFGLAGAVISFSGGHLVKVTGRVPIFIVGELKKIIVEKKLRVISAWDTFTVEPLIV